MGIYKLRQVVSPLGMDTKKIFAFLKKYGIIDVMKAHISSFSNRSSYDNQSCSFAVGFVAMPLMILPLSLYALLPSLLLLLLISP